MTYLPLPPNDELLELVGAEGDAAHVGGLLRQPGVVQALPRRQPLPENPSTFNG